MDIVEVICMKKMIIIIPYKKLRIGLLLLIFLVLLIILFYFIYSNNQNQAVYTITDGENVDGKSSINLSEAYEGNDEEKIQQYFKNWNKESKQQVKKEYEDELERNSYEIFRVVYRPYDFGSLLNERQDWGMVETSLSDLIHASEYIVIQDKISYVLWDFTNWVEEDGKSAIANYNIKRNERKYIEDFKPPVNIDEDKLLYLSKEYQDALLQFLGTQEHPFAEKNIMSPAYPKDETMRRYEFIKSYIPILYGHWGGYWHLNTHPDVGTIIINKEMDEAIALYRIGYLFGGAELKKENGKWRLIETKCMGME